MARPNKLEPLITDALLYEDREGERFYKSTEAGAQGMLAEEIIAVVLPKTRATPRGVQNALLSMFNKGHVGRAYEYVYDERGRPVLRRMRYWHYTRSGRNLPEGYQQYEYNDKPRREK
jgi:hypothetical protein